MSDERIVVGAYFNNDDNGLHSGSAYVYDLENGVWQETQKLTASDGAVNDNFGFSVAMSDERIVVGAYRDNDDNVLNSGSAYVYDLENGVWQETQKLTASDGAENDRFGLGIAMSDERIVVGAFSFDDDGNNSGSAYVYDLEDGVWQETQKLTASDGAENDRFGFSIAMSDERIVVGAYLDDDNGNNSGSAYVFEREDGKWQ
jgi:phage-related protein